MGPIDARAPSAESPLAASAAAATTEHACLTQITADFFSKFDLFPRWEDAHQRSTHSAAGAASGSVTRARGCGGR